MDFSLVNEKLMQELLELRNKFLLTSDVNELNLIARKCNVITGTNIWILSNKDDIHSLDDFREKLDAFSFVIKHPLYLELKNNLYISNLIRMFLSSKISEDELYGELKKFDYNEKLSADVLSTICADRKQMADQLLEFLKNDMDIQNSAKKCKFAMNFDFSNTDRLKEVYDVVDSFFQVLDYLESIFKEKKEEKKEKNVK